jgi:RNA polymerase sigma factor (sigma-70 family)
MGSLGDPEEAFRRIYEAHYRQIGAYARRRVGEVDAEDVTAETFLVAWRRMDAIPPGGATLPWLYGVARRVVSQRRRTGRRRDRLLARLSGLRHDEDAMANEEQLDDQQVVLAALAQLREADQEILRLSEWEELTSTELAVVLGCSANAVAIRLHRAHKRFGRALSSLEEKAAAPSERERP